MIKTKKSSVLGYFIKTMNGLAYGLFATLIIGTIIKTFADFLVDGYIHDRLVDLSTLLKHSMGLGIGIGIAWSLKLEGLRLISAGVAGALSSYMAGTIGYSIGDPLVSYIVVILTVELIGFLLSKKTPIDIILIPLLFVLFSSTITLLINQPVAYVTKAVGIFVNEATHLQPFLMGIVISVLMGMALTAPISSAAIALTIHLGGVLGDNPGVIYGDIAGGAAVVGCSVQMIGFAVMSRKDNKIGTVISVGIGTSMLQFKNIMRKPIIWLPTIIVSAILGPLATIVFNMRASEVGSGMGTSGLVGPLDVLSVMNWSAEAWLSVILLLFVLPIIMVGAIDLWFRKKGWIVAGDLKV